MKIIIVIIFIIGWRLIDCKLAVAQLISEDCFALLNNHNISVSFIVDKEEF